MSNLYPRPTEIWKSCNAPQADRGLPRSQCFELLETFAIRSYSDTLSAERLHIFAEAAKIAYAMRDRLIGDSLRREPKRKLG